jgi:hypothetical protein
MAAQHASFGSGFGSGLQHEPACAAADPKSAIAATNANNGARLEV